MISTTNDHLNITARSLKPSWLRGLLWLTAIAMAAVHTWVAAGNHSMNADGISYLDIADAYIRGDWSTALNSVWSPMYSWILGPVMAIVGPGMAWEFPLVQVVNFAIFLLALACFSFFWRQLSHFRDFRLGSYGSESFMTFPDWIWLTLGYLIFMTVSLTMIELWAVTPDMLMSAFVYLAAGLIARMRIRSGRWSDFILLGIVLGLAYLAKAIMLPVSMLFLIIALFSAGTVRRNIPRVAVTLLLFLLISLPFVGAVSWTKGRLTFGDAGSLTYAKHVNGLPYPHWQGEPVGFGTPTHPTRQILESPPIYEFAQPVGGTYPVSYDPAYWYEGLETHLDVRKQVDYLAISAQFFLDVFFNQLGGLTFAIILFYLLGRRRPSGLGDIVSNWGLALLALAVFAFYGSVNVIGRYVGVFVALFYADLLANIRLQTSASRRKLMNQIATVAILFMVLNLLLFNLGGYREFDIAGAASLPTAPPTRSPDWPGEVAQELQRLGLEPGAELGIIGFGFDSFWARLGRFKIIAQMLGKDARPFWHGGSELQSQVLDAFAGTGAEAIVAEYVPEYANLTGWHQVNDTNHYIYLLNSH